MSRQDHFVGERQSLILTRLKAKGRVLAQELALDFDVSEDTIRRDLREMAARGECERVYGGALLSSATTVPLARRMTEMPDRKNALGLAMASLFQDGMTVFIDAGSTSLAVARHLPTGVNLTVITNTPVIAADLAGRADIQLIVIGGRIDPFVGAAIDTTAISQLERMRPDLCVLGVCGLTLERGLSADIYEDSVFKRLAMQAGARTVAAITSEKLNKGAAFDVSPFTPALGLVLEHDADSDIVRRLKDQQIAIHLAGHPSGSPSSPHSLKDPL